MHGHTFKGAKMICFVECIPKCGYSHPSFDFSKIGYVGLIVVNEFSISYRQI